eukprot:TRINITY_DN6758_c0_g1_i1.p1 TRINITY_DN6758_c0_g1~~TRINITY_DN6758_c0_g1_i1.p1  ORF type:complete len:1250 (-),score=417.00 TRINITY_DN6758_c0_g1_i1:228-3977(-)
MQFKSFSMNPRKKQKICLEDNGKDIENEREIWKKTLLELISKSVNVDQLMNEWKEECKRGEDEGSFPSILSFLQEQFHLGFEISSHLAKFIVKRYQNVMENEKRIKMAHEFLEMMRQFEEKKQFSRINFSKTLIEMERTSSLDSFSLWFVHLDGFTDKDSTLILLFEDSIRSLKHSSQLSSKWNQSEENRRAFEEIVKELVLMSIYEKDPNQERLSFLSSFQSLHSICGMENSPDLKESFIEVYNHILDLISNMENKVAKKFFEMELEWLLQDKNGNSSFEDPSFQNSFKSKKNKEEKALSQVFKRFKKFISNPTFLDILERILRKQRIHWINLESFVLFLREENVNVSAHLFLLSRDSISIEDSSLLNAAIWLSRILFEGQEQSFSNWVQSCLFDDSHNKKQNQFVLETLIRLIPIESDEFLRQNARILNRTHQIDNGSKEEYINKVKIKEQSEFNLEDNKETLRKVEKEIEYFKRNNQISEELKKKSLYHKANFQKEFFPVLMNMKIMPNDPAYFFIQQLIKEGIIPRELEHQFKHQSKQISAKQISFEDSSVISCLLEELEQEASKSLKEEKKLMNCVERLSFTYQKEGWKKNKDTLAKMTQFALDTFNKICILQFNSNSSYLFPCPLWQRKLVRACTGSLLSLEASLLLINNYLSKSIDELEEHQSRSLMLFLSIIFSKETDNEPRNSFSSGGIQLMTRLSTINQSSFLWNLFKSWEHNKNRSIESEFKYSSYYVTACLCLDGIIHLETLDQLKDVQIVQNQSEKTVAIVPNFVLKRLFWLYHRSQFSHKNSIGSEINDLVGILKKPNYDGTTILQKPSFDLFLEWELSISQKKVSNEPHFIHEMIVEFYSVGEESIIENMIEDLVFRLCKENEVIIAHWTLSIQYLIWLLSRKSSMHCWLFSLLERITQSCRDSQNRMEEYNIVERYFECIQMVPPSLLFKMDEQLTAVENWNRMGGKMETLLSNRRLWEPKNSFYIFRGIFDAFGGIDLKEKLDFGRNHLLFFSLVENWDKIQHLIPSSLSASFNNVKRFGELTTQVINNKKVADKELMSISPDHFGLFGKCLVQRIISSISSEVLVVRFEFLNSFVERINQNQTLSKMAVLIIKHTIVDFGVLSNPSREVCEEYFGSIFSSNFKKMLSDQLLTFFRRLSQKHPQNLWNSFMEVETNSNLVHYPSIHLLFFGLLLEEKGKSFKQYAESQLSDKKWKQKIVTFSHSLPKQSELFLVFGRDLNSRINSFLLTFSK